MPRWYACAVALSNASRRRRRTSCCCSRAAPRSPPTSNAGQDRPPWWSERAASSTSPVSRRCSSSARAGAITPRGFRLLLAIAAGHRGRRAAAMADARSAPAGWSAACERRLLAGLVWVVTLRRRVRLQTIDLAQGQGSRRGREPRQERVRGQHEPRGPHADERHHRDDRAGAGDAAAARAAAVPRHGQELGRRAAAHPQRHPRLLEDRGRQARI